MKKRITKQGLILTMLLLVLSANTTLKAESQAEQADGFVERWSEGVSPSPASRVFTEPIPVWWKSTWGMTGIAGGITFAAYLLFILRRKRKEQQREEQAVVDEVFENDPLWCQSNNPKLRIRVDQLPQRLAMIKAAEAKKEPVKVRKNNKKKPKITQENQLI